MKSKVIQYALTHDISLSEAADCFNLPKSKETFIRGCKRFLRKHSHGNTFIDCFLKKGSAKNKKIKALLVCEQNDVSTIVINNKKALHLVKNKLGQKAYELLYNKIYRTNPKIAKSITSHPKKTSSSCIKSPFDLNEHRFT